MMAHSDVLVTVYSTMVVETAVHDTPIVAAVIDMPGGWNVPKKYSLSLKKIGNLPTHKRFRDAKAGRIAENADQLRDAINLYLTNPALDRKNAASSSNEKSLILMQLLASVRQSFKGIGEIALCTRI